MNCEDIKSVIVSFIGNMTDLLSWKYTCKSNYIQIYHIYFECNKIYDDVIPYNLNFNYNIVDKILLSKLSIVGHNVISLSCAVQFQNEHLKYFPNLKKLQCSNNRNITDLGIEYVPQLTYLDCGYCDITSEALQYIPNLEYLICGIESCFTEISNMKKLKYIDGVYNNLLCIKNVPNLEYLDCGNSKSVDGINTLTSLTHLNCGYNCFIFNSDIQHMTNLIYLDCGLNYNILDYVFINLHNLKKLYCGESIDITDEALQYLPHLTHLHCGWNTKFTNEGINHVPNLIYLHCGYNTKITNLQILTKLKYLNCGRNTSITNQSIKLCNNLIYLECWAHPLVLTDEVLSHLPNLTYLSYRYKNFTTRAISKLKKITHLSIKDAGYNPYYPDDLQIKCVNCMCMFKYD